MTTVISIILGVVILGILVFVHELGHFLMAKWNGIRVLTFSLGFGAPLIRKKWGDTEYRVSSIPFGGYVRMAGDNPEEDREGAPDEFPSKPIWQRILVALAGPVANYVFAFFLLWFTFLWGVDRPLYMERPVAGAVIDSSSAAQAGLEAGDSIVAIDDRTVTSWDDIEFALSRQEKQYTISFFRDGEKKQVSFSREFKKNGMPKQPSAGILPPVPAIVGMVNENSPAKEAGMQKGDSIYAINGDPVLSWFQLKENVENYSPNGPMQFGVVRDDTTLTFAITPEFSEEFESYLIGIRPSEGESRRVKYGFFTSFGQAAEKSWEFTTLIFDVIGKLISQEVSASQLSGPVGIIPASGIIALQGLTQIFTFMALIGINLAVLNLLPLIITDGGLILFLVLEAIRGKPLSLKMQMIINRIAIIFFLLLFLYVTFNDIRRLPEFFRFFGK